MNEITVGKLRQTSGRWKNSCGSVEGRRPFSGCGGGGYLLMGLGKSQIVFLNVRRQTPDASLNGSGLKLKNGGLRALYIF